MTDSLETKVAVQGMRQQAHEEMDEERFDTVCKDVSDIKSMIRESNEFLQKGFERVHGRIDDEASKARHNLGNEIGKVQGLVSQARQESADAVSKLEKWIYSTALGGVVAMLIYAVTTWGPLAK
jgi:hypothetical protein